MAEIYIVYKTGFGLGPQSVRKSSIIEVRVIDITLYGAVHDLWGNLTPIGTASTRGSPQTELSKKMKFRHIDHLETG